MKPIYLELGLAIAVALIVDDRSGIGFPQAAIAGVVLFGATRWWSFAGGREETTVSRRFAIGTTVATLLAFAVLAIVGPHDFRRWFRVLPEGVWWTLAPVACLGVLLTGFKSKRLRGGVLQACILGLATTAAWVPLGRLCGLDDLLRFHPDAMFFLAAASAAWFAVRLRGRGSAHWHRFFVFLVVQAISIHMYWWSASTLSPAMLGMWGNGLEMSDQHERLELVAEDGFEDRKMLFLIDRETGERVFLTSPEPPYTDMTAGWSGDKLLVGWFLPPSSSSGGCDMADISVIFRTRGVFKEFTPCFESTRPLQCLAPMLPLGMECKRSAQCASQRCEAGRCVATGLGETCVNNLTCGEGTCVARRCVVPGEDCDDDGDCEDDTYCFRRDDALVGECTVGKVGDPCTQHTDHCEFGAFCRRDAGEPFPTCKAGPMHGVTF